MALPIELSLNGNPVPKFPLSSELDKPEFRQRYPSLGKFLADRPEPFWQQAAAIADTPMDQQESFTEYDLLSRAALAIRALDRGMIDLSPSQKFTYLYWYIRTYPPYYGVKRMGTK